MAGSNPHIIATDDRKALIKHFHLSVGGLLETRRHKFTLKLLSKEYYISNNTIVRITKDPIQWNPPYL